MDRVSRFGAYGVIMQEGKLLLISQTAGVYKGLLHLPGGGIEFGESPEEALRRELKEEAALQAGKLELLSVAASTCECVKEGRDILFHHVGIIYSVDCFEVFAGVVPEELSDWYDLQELRPEQLSPFAREAFPLICQVAQG